MEETFEQDNNSRNLFDGQCRLEELAQEKFHSNNSSECNRIHYSTDFESTALK